MTRRTVFVDFSLIDSRTPVTGIPRVAYAYLEEGYVLSQKRNFDVVPVYARESGLVDARPLLLGSNWRRLRREPTFAALWQMIRSLTYFAANAFRLVLFGALAPVFVLAGALTSFAFFDFWRNQLTRVFGSLYSAAKHRINDRFTVNMQPKPGDVLFMPAYWHDTPPGYYSRLKARGLRICPMLHDVLPITHAKFYNSPWRETFRDYVFHTLTQVADHVHYISNVTRNEFERLADARGLSKPTGTVIHHGHDFTQQSVGRRLSPAVQGITHSSTPFFLMVGSIEPKKNHVAVLETFEKLWSKKIPARLVIVGRLGWKEGVIRSKLVSSPYLHSELLWLSTVSDNELSHLYRESNGLIQASAVEGFGLPILEALALGVPVLANDIPVFREVGGSSAQYFEMGNKESLERLIESCLTSRQTRDSEKWPSWAARAEELYEQLLGG
jgi:glycosyltransferase involved in cell wall biosynthesis